jgi:hypothetical protein
MNVSYSELFYVTLSPSVMYAYLCNLIDMKVDRLLVYLHVD